MKRFRMLTVVGARPQFIKAAAISRAVGARGDVEEILIHTGQHFDPAMSRVFFDELGITAPSVNLGMHGGNHGEMTGRMLAAIEEVILTERPDIVLVPGDTNSTLAGALAAAKLQVPVAHLEAGLRSFNRRMPEEHNRVLTDHAADLLLAPTEVAMRHLADENLADRSVLVGDVMVDVCFRTRDRVLAEPLPDAGLPAALDPTAPYVVATLHRPDNTDERDRLDGILDRLAALPVQVALLAHPRLVAKAAHHGMALERGAIKVGRPLAYAAMVSAVLGSNGVVTDSGGLQKEAFLLGRAGTTIRPETEWVETLEGGWNVLVPDPRELGQEEFAALVTRGAPDADIGAPYGDGTAAETVVQTIGDWT
jgi:UDP-N-acetylglucosamine 2-epimerase (non-hydrolysing)